MSATAQLTSEKLAAYLNVKLALLGFKPVGRDGEARLGEVMEPVVAQYRDRERLLASHLCPADGRIQTFLYDYLQEISVPRLPLRTLTLDLPGMARLVSLPVDKDEFSCSILNSYRVRQGVLHNPRSDRRTTQGIFHVAEGGLPIPDDKIGVPKETFARLLARAFDPPKELLRLPYTVTQSQPAECFVSLLLRPLICPEIPDFTQRKTMEIRFFAPGCLVSNLDFVESIFGNGGDPSLPENDAGLDTDHWSGHTGCVVLAPHLVHLTKKSVGLPHWDDATERQRKDGMCWKSEDELYNDGGAFKITARDASGIMVTVIADNYYGYCKKEVKTQISFASNLYGLSEEAHAGGALVFPSYDLGEEFFGDLHVKRQGHSFREVADMQAESMEVQAEGYGVDKRFSDIIYVPEDAHFELQRQRISWTAEDGEHSIKLLAGKTYMRPSGYKVRLEQSGVDRTWRLVGTVAEGVLCHKPSTVSGGGKSEISKPITDAILSGPVFVADFKKDFDRVAELLTRDYSDRFRDTGRKDPRSILSPERSLGSVIKLLTPDEHDYQPEYNQWLETVPQYIKELVFVVKRVYQPEWGDNWREHFSVDIVNGKPANELKYGSRRLVSSSLRVGFEADGSWRTFGLRKDFYPATKIQTEDDITASVVVPPKALKDLPQSDDLDQPSLRFILNAETRLFQRPDDAIHRGYDKVTEKDFIRTDNFFSNYEPLPVSKTREFIEDAMGFSQFTEPMQQFIRSVDADGKPGYFVSNAVPRIVDGKFTKNPRYLQYRTDLAAPQQVYLAEMSARLRRRLPPEKPVRKSVSAVLPGRRNNPAEPGVRALACYGPIHYFDLPELFMEFICSMTGKSPSTTGFGSEGALTKGPFNALPPIIDLNNALVSFVLCGHSAFVTAAGYVGPKVRVDHDISLLVPEVWCRMLPEERNPAYLIAERCLEPCKDFDYEGRRVLGSRLGYRITSRFVRTYFARVFNHPHAVFTEEMLHPEKQDLATFVEGIETVVTTQKRVAEAYFRDGSIKQACPPLAALLHIMLHDQWNGAGLDNPEFRAMFKRESLLASDWYAKRLEVRQRKDITLWKRHVHYLERFLKRTGYAHEATRLGIPHRLARARHALATAESPEYLQSLRGTIGAEPIDAYTSQPA